MSPAETSRGLCFVVSPIGADKSATRERADRVLRYVISPAAESVGFRVERGDEITKPGAVVEQIIANLISAEAVVADLTELNPNVFYELAIRDSFRMPAVLVAEVGTVLPFDLVQQRTIFFDHTDLQSVDVAKRRLADALVQSIGNPTVSSPVSKAAERGTLERERSLLTLSESVTDALRAEVQRLISESPQRAQSVESPPDDIGAVVLRLLFVAEEHGVIIPWPRDLADVVERLGPLGLRKVHPADLEALRRYWRRWPAGTRTNGEFRANTLVRREMWRRGIDHR
jgi:hypothetical protein